MILKWRIHQEDINILNIYASKLGAPKTKRKILEDFKNDKDSITIIVEDLNTPLSKMNRSSKKNQQRYCSIEKCPRANGMN